MKPSSLVKLPGENHGYTLNEAFLPNPTQKWNKVLSVDNKMADILFCIKKIIQLSDQFQWSSSKIFLAWPSTKIHQNVVIDLQQ